MAKFTMRLRSVGNPDFNQYAPISNPVTVTGDTLKEMSNKARQYIKCWELGGGNFPNAVVKDTITGESVAWISYNGRVWDRADWRKAQEIPI
jgi:hypothetical protein